MLIAFQSSDGSLKLGGVVTAHVEDVSKRDDLIDPMAGREQLDRKSSVAALRMRLVREIFFIFFLSLGCEQTGVENPYRLIEGLSGGKFQAFESRGIHHALHRMHIKLACESRIHVVAHGASDLAFFDETAEGITDAGTSRLADMLINVRGGALNIAEDFGADVAEPLNHHESKSAKLFDKAHVELEENFVYLGADTGRESIDRGDDNRVLVGKVHVEGLFAHPQFTREFVHREGAVAETEEVPFRLQ